MSNAMCNNFVYSRLIIGDMHETMKRLYQAAKCAGVEGKSEVARKMDQSPQTLNNWEARGMSKGGMLTAQRVFGCSAVWLETGQDDIGAATDDFRAALGLADSSERSILLSTIRTIINTHKKDERKTELPVIVERRKKV